VPQPESESEKAGGLDSLKRHPVIAALILSTVVAAAAWKTLDQLLVRPRDERIRTLEQQVTADAFSVRQHAIRIEGVDLDLDSEKRPEQALLIIVKSNGIAKSYPTDGWARPNPNLTSDPFMVPEAPEYLISFQVFAKDARGAITRFLTQSDLRIKAASMPASELRVELHEEGTTPLVGGRVKFRVD
jgi:hypothetical protein